MEVTLKGGIGKTTLTEQLGFNPCFNGSDSKSFLLCRYRGSGGSFNPCFNGSDSKSFICLVELVLGVVVSILVLMEVTLKGDIRHDAGKELRGFNPCFNGSDSKRIGKHAALNGELRFQSLF